MTQRPALVVLGMHRSGTSALTRVLSLHGLATSRGEMGARPDNPRGFWEPPAVQQFNDRILAAIGSSWDDPGLLPRPLLPMRTLAAARREARAILRREFPGDAPFVLKEPRMARLMAIWRPALISAGVAPRIVLPIRNPLEVAQSLERRNGMALQAALRLWLGHVLAAEHDTRGLPRAVLHYDRLMRDWRSAVAPALRLLPEPAAFRPDRAAVEDFLTGSLRHHAVTTAALLRDARVPPTIKQVYAEFRRMPLSRRLHAGLLDAAARRLAEGSL